MKLYKGNVVADFPINEVKKLKKLGWSDKPADSEKTAQTKK